VIILILQRFVLNNTAIAGLTLLTDGNEKPTVYNTITKTTVATVGENLSAKDCLPVSCLPCNFQL
ncbi:MAG: hypothetical protein LBC20_01240, partial [Planctomycetaceae bacterium]|nr:hypothetical protein [Planctomycetaceae bacterium]